MPIRVLIVDDHTILRQGIRRILERSPDFTVVGEAGSGLEAVELVERLEPRVVIMDIGMKQLNGIEATAEIINRWPKTGVLILSMYADERYVIRAIKSGASGYLLKDNVEEEDLLSAIRAVNSGQSFFSPAVAKTLLDSFAKSLRDGGVEDRYDLLTTREKQVYVLIAEGKSNKDVASLLNLSVHTIETHRVRIMEKLDVHSPTELVLSAVRRGLIT